MQFGAKKKSPTLEDVRDYQHFQKKHKKTAKIKENEFSKKKYHRIENFRKTQKCLKCIGKDPKGCLDTFKPL